MIQLPGAWFSMGDKSEIDAKPHRVRIDAFTRKVWLTRADSA